MKCKYCGELGQTSRVYPGGSASTLMGGNHGFYNEEGVYHYHDGNRRTNHFSCSKGHRWYTSSHPSCPQDDYDTELRVIREPDDENLKKRMQREEIEPRIN